MSETTLSTGSTISSDPASVQPTAPISKETLIAEIKAKVLAMIEDAEKIVGRELTELRADLAAIGSEPGKFWDSIKAWFQKHL